MNKNIDLAKDNISKTLIKLSLPIMSTLFIQMAYNMTDMMWVGKIGSDAVATVGTAGLFPWLAMMVFTFLNPVLTAIFNGMGNSKTPFFINTFGLIVNIILDPLLIFNFELGVIGAAIATTLAQMIITLSFIFIIIKEKNSYFKFKLFKNIDFDAYKKLINLGIPVALQNRLFTIIAMIIGVVVASFGPVAIAA